MMDLICILLLYTIQGCIQGLAFGTLPMLMMRNPGATNVHQSKFSVVGYPFSLKFLLAPLVDGIYWLRLGRRESWLLPLQLVTAILLAVLSPRVIPMLEATPPMVSELTVATTILVFAAATGDIATDAWAAGRMSDSRASMCQTIGLTLGMEGSVTIFFLLKGRSLVDVDMLFIVISALAFAVLGVFVIRMLLSPVAANPPGEEDDDEAVGVWTVLQRIWALVCTSSNLRWFLAFLVLIPIFGAHGAVLGVRYQKLGFTPEMFADYDLYLLPVSFFVMWIGGKLAHNERKLTVLARMCVIGCFLDVAQLFHFHLCERRGPDATQDMAIRFSYIALSQVKGALGTFSFITRVASFNKIAQQNEAIAGTVITFLASISNMGGQLPGTWVPLVVDSVGLYALAAGCMTIGSLVLFFFSSKLQALDNMNDAGWKKKEE